MKQFYGTKLILAEPQASVRNEGEEAQEGYKVQYNDGYTSWSPKKQFEDAYQSFDSLSFGHALVAMKDGMKVARSGWNGKGMWLELQTPDENSKMSLPYVFLNYPKESQAYPTGAKVPWLASQTDMLANDWAIVD